jgi:hypothetical protein
MEAVPFSERLIVIRYPKWQNIPEDLSDIHYNLIIINYEIISEFIPILK